MESGLPPPEFDNFGHRAEDKHLPPRVTKLEVEVSDLKARLEQTATKEDLANAVAMLIKWLVGAWLGSVTLVIVVMTFVLNYAAPPQGRFARPLPEALASALAEGAVSAAPPIVIVIPPSALQLQAQPQTQNR